jgi:hypothetical protein
VEIRLSSFNVGFEHVEERLKIFFLDQFRIFGERDAENGDNSSLIVGVGLLALVFDKVVPHVGESLRFDYNKVFVDRLFNDSL